MSNKYIKIPLEKTLEGYSVYFGQDIYEKLNLGQDCKSLYATYTDKGLEIQKMVNVDLDLDESTLEVLERAAKEQNMSVQELILKSLENILE